MNQLAIIARYNCHKSLVGLAITSYQLTLVNLSLMFALWTTSNGLAVFLFLLSVCVSIIVDCGLWAEQLVTKNDFDQFSEGIHYTTRISDIPVHDKLASQLWSFISIHQYLQLVGSYQTTILRNGNTIYDNLTYVADIPITHFSK